MTAMNKREALLKQISTYQFAALDLQLYLDTHPHCRQAIQYYKKHRDALKEAVSLYEEKYGPMTMYGINSCDNWTWVHDPWPWEIC